MELAHHSVIWISKYDSIPLLCISLLSSFLSEVLLRQVSHLSPVLIKPKLKIREVIGQGQHVNIWNPEFGQENRNHSSFLNGEDLI